MQKMTIRFYNQAGELEAEVETDSAATILEFAQDFRDANGFIRLCEGEGKTWEIHEPTTKQAAWLQERNNATIG